MSTSGLTGIVVNGVKKYTYNHFDSYPSVLGRDVVKFVKAVSSNDIGWEKFKENAKNVILVNNDLEPTAKEIRKYAKFSDITVSDRTNKDWYCLMHKLQGVEILKAIYAGKVKHMIDSKKFIKHSLLCIYAYIINLDTMKLEMYKGHQKRGDKYIACKKVAKFPLNDIPQNWIELIS